MKTMITVMNMMSIMQIDVLFRDNPDYSSGGKHNPCSIRGGSIS